MIIEIDWLKFIFTLIIIICAIWEMGVILFSIDNCGIKLRIRINNCAWPFCCALFALILYGKDCELRELKSSFKSTNTVENVCAK